MKFPVYNFSPLSSFVTAEATPMSLFFSVSRSLSFPGFPPWEEVGQQGGYFGGQMRSPQFCVQPHCDPQTFPSSYCYSPPPLSVHLCSFHPLGLNSFLDLTQWAPLHSQLSLWLQEDGSGCCSEIPDCTFVHLGCPEKLTH